VLARGDRAAVDFVSLGGASDDDRGRSDDAQHLFDGACDAFVGRRLAALEQEEGAGGDQAARSVGLAVVSVHPDRRRAEQT
jgi:hypothetical protein